MPSVSSQEGHLNINAQCCPNFPGYKKHRSSKILSIEQAAVIEPFLVQHGDGCDITRCETIIDGIRRDIDYFCVDDISTTTFEFAASLITSECEHGQRTYNKPIQNLFSKFKRYLPNIMIDPWQTKVEPVQDEYLEMFKCSDVLVALYRNELNNRFTDSFSRKIPVDLLKPDKQPDQAYSDLITETIEGLLANKAHRHAIVGEFGNIALTTNSGRFTEEFCMELIDRLDLDPYNPTRILFQIYHELVKSINNRISPRKWGRLVKTSSGKIEMNVQCDDYLQEYYSEIDDSLWQSS